MSINPRNILGDILGLDASESVVVCFADWTERRAMMTADEKVKFRQGREEDGDWLVIDFIAPQTDDWADVQRRANAMSLDTPFVVWSGPVNDIPAKLLLSDQPMMVRCVDSSGWFNFRREALREAAGYVKA